MSEQALVNDVIAYIFSIGGWAMRVNSGTQVIKGELGTRVFRGAPKGTADVIGCLSNGRFIAVECKIGSNTCSLEQTIFLDRIKEAGGLAFACWDNIDAVISEVQKAGIV